MRSVVLIVCVLANFFYGSAFVQVAHAKNSATKLAISAAFDQQGKLWRTSVREGFVFVDSSMDQGKIFSKPVKVNKTSQKVAARGEGRPKIAIGLNDYIYLTWTQTLKKPFAGYIWFSRSTDGGKSFEKPKIVHQDRAEITHRFDALNVAPNGRITVTWIDKRDLEAAKKAEKKYSGAAIYYAVSTDNGASFQIEKKLADSSCECCRIAMTTKPDGTVVALWRHVFEGGERDHMIAEIPKSGKTANLKRATFGHWKLDGCPHHGGAIARGGEGTKWWGYHMAYFDGKDKKPGLYYSRMDGEAWVTSPAKQFGDNAKQARHPALLSMGKKVWLVWLETTANNTKKVLGVTSADSGKTWSDVDVLLSVKGKVDYPQLLQYKDNAYLVVNTDNGLNITSI
ncbi:MAG: sialidase family protein [Methylophilaceae bacterium]